MAGLTGDRLMGTLRDQNMAGVAQETPLGPMRRWRSLRIPF